MLDPLAVIDMEVFGLVSNNSDKSGDNVGRTVLFYEIFASNIHIYIYRGLHIMKTV